MKKLYFFVFIFIIIGCSAEKKETNQITQKIRFVDASFETEQVNAIEGEDAADDPAIWINPIDASKSIIYGSNKKGGIENYDFSGKRLRFFELGRFNNIDIQYGFPFDSLSIDILGGSNRTTNTFDIFSISPSGDSISLILSQTVKTIEEVYGFCLYKTTNNEFFAFVNGKSGKVEQWKLKCTGDSVYAEFANKMAAPTQVEGMVVDAEQNLLFLGEEDGGILKFDLSNKSDTAGTYIENSSEENTNIKFDIEGLCLYPKQNNEGYLIASSQGNNTFAVFNRKPPHKYIKSFQIKLGKDTVKETDGIDVYNINFGKGFEKGVFVCQDGFNKSSGKDVPQNFKIVAWSKIENSLR